MKKTIRILVRGLCIVALLTYLPSAQAIAKEPPKKVSGNASMHLHHMHTMINHGLIMALQGSNLVMLSEMKMAPGVDEITLSHGKKMIADGKTMVKDMLSGDHMTAMHKGGQANSPLMTYTHNLANASLKVIAGLEEMKMGDINSPDVMKMHHMHIALNHALEMAADGSNLIMMGQMHMAKGVDKHTIDHGKQMINDSLKLWKDVMGGSAMADMHSAGTTPQASENMGATHQLANDQKKVLDLLANMPTVK
jgi:hypothetical protein